MELLALAASSTWPSTPLEIDESISCGSPGKIIDPYILTETLKLPADQQVYYGASTYTPQKNSLILLINFF